MNLKYTSAELNQVLALRREGLSYKAIGKQLGMPEGSVCYLIQRGVPKKSKPKAKLPICLKAGSHLWPQLVGWA